MKLYRYFTYSKLLAFVTILIIFVGFGLITGCKKLGTIKIGIIQIVEHESFDDAKQGFEEQIKELGYDNVEYEVQNAGGDLSNCYSIAQKFVNDRKDLIFALSTPCAQAAANATKDIPIVATAITDFEGAGLVDSNEVPYSNVTGTSDLAPLDKIIGLVLELNPNAKTVGILYSDTDPSPQYQAEIAKKEAQKLGLKTQIATVSQSQEVEQVTQELVKKVDALYVPIDKITFSAMPRISTIFLDNRKFVVCAEDVMIGKGAAATFSLSYQELGRQAAFMAGKILAGESSPKDMPINHLEDFKLSLNHKIMEKLNLTPVHTKNYTVK